MASSQSKKKILFLQTFVFHFLFIYLLHVSMVLALPCRSQREVLQWGWLWGKHKLSRRRGSFCWITVSAWIPSVRYAWCTSQCSWSKCVNENLNEKSTACVPSSTGGSSKEQHSDPGEEPSSWSAGVRAWGALLTLWFFGPCAAATFRTHCNRWVSGVDWSETSLHKNGLQ